MRTVLANQLARLADGAAVLILKRMANAVKDGDTIRAVIRESGNELLTVTPHASQQVLGHCGAASGLLSVVAAVSYLDRQMTWGRQYWIHDRAGGPRCIELVTAAMRWSGAIHPGRA